MPQYLIPSRWKENVTSWLPLVLTSRFYADMRLKLLGVFIVIGCFLFLSCDLLGQNCVVTGLNNTVISYSCSQVCRDLTFQVPDLGSSSTYTVVNIPYNPYSYVTAGGTEDFRLYNDDNYSAIFNLPFPFCFYDSVYTKAVISSNGLVTFDPANASCINGGAAYYIDSTIPHGGFLSCTPDDYPRASIMAAFMDLDPRRPEPLDPTFSSPPDRKIEWRVEGTAPCRRFVVSYYHIGAFRETACGQNPDSAATFQIVMYESTGLIDIFFQNKTCNALSLGGTKSILGVQNFSRTKAVAAPGKNATTWTASNEGYRFVSTGGASRYVSSELLAMNLSHIAWANSSNTTAGLLDLTFPNICSPATSTQYIVKTIFSACDNPVTQLISMDTIIINLTGSLNATATTTNTACGPPSGTITVNVPAGSTLPLSYTLDGGTPVVIGALTHTFTNVAQGQHTIVVTDGNGCTSNVNVTVNITNSINANTSTTPTVCGAASNGTITIAPIGGIAPFTFILDAGAPQAGPAPYTFANVSAGPHTIIVNDASGCITNPITVNVATGPGVNGLVLATATVCPSAANGTITADATGGTAPFTYQLDAGAQQNGANPYTFTNVSAGNHTVTITDNFGCSSPFNVTVPPGSALIATASTVAVVCNDQSNGIITVATGGGVAPYQYSIDGGATWQSSNTFNVAAGTYTITIRDNNNCTTTQSVTVTEPAALTANSANTDASCGGGNDGTISVTANGGNIGYQYSLDGTTFQSSNIFNVAPGNYTTTVKDNLGCITTFNTIVGLNNNLTLTPQTNPTICEGTSTQLQLNSNATQYVWTPATALSNPGIFNPVANPTVTTQYIVTAILGRCSANDTVIVNVNTAPIPDAGTAGFICYGQSYQLQGSGGTSFSWTPSSYLNSTNISNPVSTPGRTITYTLSVVDANGCNSLVTDDVIVDVTPPIRVTTSPHDTIGYPGDKFQLIANSAANIYTWSPATGLSDPNIPNPVVTAGTIGDDVVYKVTASTNAGCKGEGYVRIRVYKGQDIYVPTGFTPNNDGKNDKFIPFPVGIKKINYFRVFDRWGQIVYSTSTLNEGWDGKFGGKEQSSGVYVWMVQGITKDDRVITKKGTVMLIR